MKVEFADILLIISFTIFLVLFIWYIIGDSPTFEQIILGAIFLNITLSVRNVAIISRIQGRFEEHLRKHS